MIFHTSVEMINLASPFTTRLALLAHNVYRHTTKFNKLNPNFNPSINPQNRKFSSTKESLKFSHTPHSSLQPNQAKSPGLKDDEKDEGISYIDENISIEYPESDELPRTPIVQGRGERHFKRTLAQFSLEESVTVVTGGASGIGLAISQGIMASGSHVAIVDMNREDSMDQV